MVDKFALPHITLNGKHAYLVAIFAGVLMIGLRFLLQPILHNAALLVLPTVAVTLSALYGGLGPGLLATLLSIIFSWLLFTHQDITTRSSLNDFMAGITVFAITGLLMSVLGELIHRGQAYSASLVQQLKHRNDELQQSELMNRALLDASAQGIIGIDEDGIIKIANDFAYTLFGYEKNELIGQPVVSLLDETVQQQFQLYRRDFLSKQVAKNISGFPLNGRRKDGAMFSAEASMGIAKTPLGLIGVAYISDITDKKLIEAALLREQSELQHLVYYSPVLISMQDLEGRVLLVNRSFITTFSPDETNLSGRSIKDIFPDFIASKFIEVDRRILSNKESVEFEFEIPDQEKSWRQFKMIKFPLNYLDTNEIFGIGNFATDITELREAERKLLLAEKQDFLTGLPNRVMTYDKGRQLIKDAKEAQSKIAFLFFDLDRFKPVNDTYGREIGDLVLKEVAKRLLDIANKNDVVGRIGSDEFIALLTHIRSKEDIESFANKFLIRLREPYLTDGFEIRMSPSIGISQYPEDGNDIDKLIHCADAAMHHAKNSGRNRYEFFSAALIRNGARTHILEQELRSALDENLLKLFYQPIIESRTGNLSAVEALLRWPTLSGDVRMPTEFIGAAEASGLILLLGEWVVKTVCKEFEERIALGMQPVKVTINVSATQFRSPDFTDNLLSLIRNSTMGHEWLELEVTESTVMSRINEAAKTLSSLKEKGFSVSLDDFGTGYSSLSHLARLPIDKLKIDRSFVRHLETESRSLAITESVIALGHKLGIEVIAEGIETISVFSRLLSMGCNHFQGYLFSKPIPSNDLVTWEKTRSRKIIPLFLPDSASPST